MGDPSATPPPELPLPSARVLLVGVLALVAVVFLPTLWFGFVYDDHWTLLANGFLRCPEELALLLQPEATARHVPDASRPVAVAFDVLSVQLLGARPVPHHVLSLALHVGCTAALAWWLRRRGVAAIDTAVVAAIFGTLAIHAEVVAVVSYREDLLACGLGLLAMIAADAAARDGTTGRARALALGATAGLAALACGAKLSAVTLGVIWPVTARLGPGSPLPRWRAPTVALLLGTALALAQQQHVLGGLSPYEAQAGIHAAGFSRAAVLAASVQIHLGYVQQMLLPLGLSPEYVDAPGSWRDAATLMGAAGFGLALAHAIAVRRSRPLWTAVAITTVLAWLPTANLVPMPNMRADRFAYGPSVLVAVGLGAALLSAGRALAQRVGVPAARLAPALAFVVLQGAFAQTAASAYKNDARLWEVALQRAPESARAHALLGELAIATLRRGGEDEGDPVVWARAQAHCLRALALAPGDALPHLCAARLAVARKQWSAAHASFEAALDRARAREDRILMALASVTLDVPELPYAERIARVDALLARALREFPYASEVAAAGGRLLHRLGRPAQALALYQRARKLRPERWDVALWGLELALDLGDAAAALTLWERGEDLWSEADPKLVDAARSRVYDAQRLFADSPPLEPLPLIDLLPELPPDHDLR
ncbi:MAG: tetratricopeptide repeat protein [Nannocystaceae bacterium]|nr:tetratricopeptide repeat protein [Nannocystaceae bacterium]